MRNLIFAFGASSFLLLGLFGGGTYAQASDKDLTKSAELKKSDKTSKSDIQDARNGAEDDGYTAQADTLKGHVDQLATAAKEALSLNANLINTAALENLTGATNFYQRLHGTCVKTQSTASWMCREKTSPQLQEGLNQINTVVGMISGAAIQDACSNFAKIAKLGQMALTAYTAACSSARAACEASCATVYNNLKRLSKFEFGSLHCHSESLMAAKATLPTDPNYPTAQKIVAACAKLDASISTAQGYLDGTVLPHDFQEADKKSVALKNKACTYEYASMILSAGTGIASMINGLKQGQKCDEDTNGTGGTVAAAAKDKCEDPANAQLPECICKANPRTPGCANSYQKANESGDSRLTASGADVNPAPLGGKDGLGGLGLGGDGSTLGENGAGGGSDSGGIGAPMGGGSGLSGFGGSGGGGGGGKEEAAKKGLNTDILSGSGGGGGGGGFGGYRGAASDSKYRAYLPGGAKDPAQGLAGQQAWTKEVTGQGGKSNWEKVRERYRDNKNTLLNN